MPELNPRLTLQEAVKILRLSKATLYRREAEGKIKFTRDGGKTFITRADLEKYLTALTAGSN
jgi:excisionase family DNA binding protein